MQGRQQGTGRKKAVHRARLEPCPQAQAPEQCRARRLEHARRASLTRRGQPCHALIQIAGPSPTDLSPQDVLLPQLLVLPHTAPQSDPPGPLAPLSSFLQACSPRRWHSASRREGATHVCQEGSQHLLKI